MRFGETHPSDVGKISEELEARKMSGLYPPKVCPIASTSAEQMDRGVLEVLTEHSNRYSSLQATVRRLYLCRLNLREKERASVQAKASVDLSFSVSSAVKFPNWPTGMLQASNELLDADIDQTCQISLRDCYLV